MRRHVYVGMADDKLALVQHKTQLYLVQVRRENIPALPASDWSVVRIYPRFLLLIGPL